MAALSCSQGVSSRLAPVCMPSAPFSSVSPAAPVALFAPRSCSAWGLSLRKIHRASKRRGFLLQPNPTTGYPTRAQTKNEETSDSKSGSGPEEKIPFGYTRKDVIFIGVGLVAVGVGLKFGLEAFGVDSLKAGNAVQLIMVLGLTLGWISSYVFRVSTKDMTYAKQLKDYENKVMEKRLQELPEAELEAMLAQAEEDKRRLQERRNKVL